MNIRFLIHDKAAYPDGALLEVDFGALPTKHAALLRLAIDDFGYCNRALQVAGVNVANIWLSEPTLESLRSELARVAGVVAEFTERRERHLARRKR